MIYIEIGIYLLISFVFGLFIALVHPANKKEDVEVANGLMALLWPIFIPIFLIVFLLRSLGKLFELIINKD
jgi:hypothetical protein